jgi:hypothetical protein
MRGIKVMTQVVQTGKHGGIPYVQPNIKETEKTVSKR